MSNSVMMPRDDWVALLDSIREKGGTTDLMTVSQAKDAVEAIETGGGEIFTSPYSGLLYTKNHIQNVNISSPFAAWQTGSLVPSAGAYAGATEMETFELHVTGGNVVAFDNNRQMLFSDCTKLITIVLDLKISYLTGANMFRNCNSLQKVQIGGIDKPFSASDVKSNLFGSLASITDVVIYVDAASVDDIPAKLIENAPFGAPNASIVYKNSNTGEVITA